MDEQYWIIRGRHSCEVAGDDDIVRTDLPMNDVQSLEHYPLGLFHSGSGRRFQSNTHQRTVRIWKEFCAHPWNSEVQEQHRHGQVADDQRPPQPEYDSEIAPVR